LFSERSIQSTAVKLDKPDGILMCVGGVQQYEGIKSLGGHSHPCDTVESQDKTLKLGKRAEIWHLAHQRITLEIQGCEAVSQGWKARCCSAEIP
jgi:hypothetical protein